MEKLRVVSLFSGIGAFEKGLKDANIGYELVNYCEINEHASKCYAAIHNEPESKNLWDITKISDRKFNNIDLITHGSPCQDFSINGSQSGGDIGSGTRSSLMWDTVNIVKNNMPNVVVWENVKNAISKDHLHNVELYIKILNDIGYTSTYKVLNSKNYGIPQNRDRVFIVSVLKGKEFVFPKGVELGNTLLSMCNFREKDDITEAFENYYTENVKAEMDFNTYFKSLKINRTGVKNMGMYKYDQLNRVTVTNCFDSVLSPTLSCRGVQNYCVKFLHNERIYKPSPRMCFRLMGFSDDDFEKVKDIGMDKDLWDRAGNSIVTTIPKYIFKELFKEYIEIK